MFLKSNPHPRAYGNFSRFLGHYVRERGVTTLAEAVRRMTALPADNLKLRRRGRLIPGHFADVVVFDPETIADHATFAEPHAARDGREPRLRQRRARARRRRADRRDAGRVVRGPGWTGWAQGE